MPGSYLTARLTEETRLPTLPLGLGFRVWGLGFEVFAFRVEGIGLRAQGLRV